VRRLLAAGLLSTRAVIDGSLRVSRAAGRNVNFAVTTRDGPSYLVKYGRGDGGRHEAVAYGFLSTVASREVRAALPLVVTHATQDSMLVLEHVSGPTLRGHHARRSRRLSSWAGRSGALLAAVHDLPVTAVPACLREVRIRSVHRPDELLFATSSRAGVELTELIQSDPVLCAALDEQAARTADEAFTHGDVRWDNILVARDGDGRFAGLRLVDWESAGVGDPGWDIGCLLAEYVSHWICSVPFTTATTAAADAALARVPLESAQAAIAAAWAGYIMRRGAGCADGPTCLRRVTRHAGHRLLHRALELDQYSTDVSLAAVCHVQVGARMLAEPDVASTALLGLPITGNVGG
jgi:aminoglycoside phosphotransferase (APT) family kinase protein